MLGYISADKCELKVRELNDYNAYYCGLCRSVSSRYGQIARLTLSYDCAFIAMLVSSLRGEKDAKMRCCGYKPLSKKRLIACDSDAFRFAADMEIAIAWHKCKDDWSDEKKLSALAGKAGLSHAVKRLHRLSPSLASIVESGINELSGLERERCAEIDVVAGSFAQMMRDTAKFAPLEKERDKKILSCVLYELGKWVYLADAWDDRKKDKKSGAYNPFIASGAENDLERASFLLNISLNKAIEAYELLDPYTHRGVLDNIMYRGCVIKTKELLGGNDEQSL